MWRVTSWVCVCAALAVARGLQLRCADVQRCRLTHSHDDQGWFTVEGNKIDIRYEDGKFLQVVCTNQKALDSTALPSFSSALHVPHVRLWACPPPAAGGSYARVLSALNVTLLRSATQGNLTIEEMPPHPPLQAQHFAGLEDLVQLEIFYANPKNQLAPLPGFLSPLRSLRVLKVVGVTLPWVDFDLLPTTLCSLTLQLIAIERLFDGLLALHDLNELDLALDNLTQLQDTSTLQSLYLNPENTTFRLQSIPDIENFTLIMWSESRPEEITQCNKLRKLEFRSPAVEVLPDGWVARCSLLEHLDIVDAMHLVSLSSKLLENATGLRYLSITRGVLETLPEGLFDYVPNLLTLDLWGNRIQMLPSKLFANQGALQSLDLSHNLLLADAVDELRGLHFLEKLDLNCNPRFTNLCERSGYSQLLRLKKLKHLSLMETNITRICRDWRENLTLLENLDLKWTSISELEFSDLQYVRDDSIKYSAAVELYGSPVVLVRYTEEDYHSSLAAPRSGAKVWLNTGKLECDCRMYWARRALFPPELEYWDATSDSARVQGLVCSTDRRLSQMPLDELVCPEQAAWLPARCSLTTQPAPLHRRLQRVHCDSAALTRLPPLPHSDRVMYDLLLSNNNISHVDLQDLPPLIRILDLRNNSIERVEEETALHVLRMGRMLLGGNPLACDCRSAPLLIALHAAGSNASDLSTATCANGSLLQDAPTHHCDYFNVNLMKNNLLSII